MLAVYASLFIATGSLGVLALFASIQEPTLVQTSAVSGILLTMAGLG